MVVFLLGKILLCNLDSPQYLFCKQYREFKVANINIKGPEDYKFYVHTSREGNVWLDGKGEPIPLCQPLVNNVDSISPIDLWNSRCTRKSIHPKDTLPRKGGAYNSTTFDKDTPTSTPSP